MTYLFGAKRGEAAADDTADNFVADDVVTDEAENTETIAGLSAAEKAAARQWAIESGEITTVSSAPSVADEPVTEPQRPRRIPAFTSTTDDDEGAADDFDAESDRAGETDRAHNVALHALARRGVSVSEMRKLLKSRDLDEDIVDEEIARLEAVALLDDSALAETLVRTLQERKGLGRSGVTNELRRRGIEQETISLALESEDAGDEEAERALELAMKRAPQLRSYDNATAKRRLSGFLMRRGYSGQVVSQAVDAALSGSGSSGSSRGPRFQ